MIGLRTTTVGSSAPQSDAGASESAPKKTTLPKKYVTSPPNQTKLEVLKQPIFRSGATTVRPYRWMFAPSAMNVTATSHITMPQTT